MKNNFLEKGLRNNERTLTALTLILITSTATANQSDEQLLDASLERLKDVDPYYVQMMPGMWCLTKPIGKKIDGKHLVIFEAVASEAGNFDCKNYSPNDKN